MIIGCLQDWLCILLYQIFNVPVLPFSLAIPLVFSPAIPSPTRSSLPPLSLSTFPRYPLFPAIFTPAIPSPAHYSFPRYPLSPAIFTPTIPPPLSSLPRYLLSDIPSPAILSYSLSSLRLFPPPLFALPVLPWSKIRLRVEHSWWIREFLGNKQIDTRFLENMQVVYL